MKTNFVFILIASAGMFLFSGCGNSNKEIMRLIEERDSLRDTNESQASKLNNYGKTIEMMNATLDSIAIQEKMLFVGNL